MLSRFLPVAPQTSLCAISLCKRIPGRQRYCKSATMVAALETSDKLTFYDLEGGCPYANRVWLTLVEKGLPFDMIKVDVANRPAEFTALYRSVSGDEHLGKVPMLQDGDTTLIESLPIVEWLDWRFPEAGTRMLPEDVTARYKVKLFVDVFTNNISGFSLLGASTQKQLTEVKGKLVDGLKVYLMATSPQMHQDDVRTGFMVSPNQVVEKFLQIHAVDEAPGYFLGSQYSYAEAAISPFVRRYSVGLPAVRNVDLHAIIEEKGLKRLQKWIKAVLDRPSIQETTASDEVLIQAFKKYAADITD